MPKARWVATRAPENPAPRSAAAKAPARSWPPLNTTASARSAMTFPASAVGSNFPAATLVTLVSLPLTAQRALDEVAEGPGEVALGPVVDQEHLAGVGLAREIDVARGGEQLSVGDSCACERRVDRPASLTCGDTPTETETTGSTAFVYVVSDGEETVVRGGPQYREDPLVRHQPLGHGPGSVRARPRRRTPAASAATAGRRRR